MDLAGEWRAAISSEVLRKSLPDPAFDDASWESIKVPGHWRSHAAFASTDGPLLYRRRFNSSPLGPRTRAFVALDGVFYQSDVWLDGTYLGSTEGYFVPHAFEVASALHLLAVEVTCNPPGDFCAKRALTGIFQHWDCIERSWNPGGIWAPVRLEESGPVRLGWLKILCRDASAEAATLELEAGLDSAQATTCRLTTTVRRQGARSVVHELSAEHALAAGINVVRWRAGVERPELWWPHALGPQPLYDVEVAVSAAGELSDQKTVTTGLRQVRMDNFIATINGERMYLKGANLAPTRRELGEATAAELARDVTLAREAGLDLIRVHAHISRPELYEAADRQGMLVWQDLPLQWGYGQVRRQAVSQARHAVSLLGHHPSVAIWCAHNEPMAVDLLPGAQVTPRMAVRFLAGQALPTWNKTVLDRSLRRALERADRSRPVIAHSGVLPHPAWGSDSHLYFGWYHGSIAGLAPAMATLPVLARFVSEFGAQAVPSNASFMEPQRWPELDWARLSEKHCYQRAIFEQRVPPSQFGSFEEWKDATQRYQAGLLRFSVETLRRLKYCPTGGFCMFVLNDAQPAVSWSVLDYERDPKEGYRALQAACAAVIVTALGVHDQYAPGSKFSAALHVVSDLREPLEDCVVKTVLSWPGGRRSWRFGGKVPADSCVAVGELEHTFGDDVGEGEVKLGLSLRWDGGEANNCYTAQLSAPRGGRGGGRWVGKILRRLAASAGTGGAAGEM
jgi:beta-mannosidase